MSTPKMAVFLGPNRSMDNPESGDRNPISAVRIENPTEMAATLQPSSSLIGVMNTPNVKTVMPRITKLDAAPASTMRQP